MGRTVDQDVHAAFVEFRAKEDDKVIPAYCLRISKQPVLTISTHPSACPCNASTVSKSERRTHRVRNNISSSVLAYAVIPTHHNLHRQLRMELVHLMDTRLLRWLVPAVLVLQMAP